MPWLQKCTTSYQAPACHASCCSTPMMMSGVQSACASTWFLPWRRLWQRDGPLRTDMHTEHRTGRPHSGRLCYITITPYHHGRRRRRSVYVYVVSLGPIDGPIDMDNDWIPLVRSEPPRPEPGDLAMVMIPIRSISCSQPHLTPPPIAWLYHHHQHHLQRHHRHPASTTQRQQHVSFLVRRIQHVPNISPTREDPQARIPPHTCLCSSAFTIIRICVFRTGR